MLLFYHGWDMSLSQITSQCFNNSPVAIYTPCWRERHCAEVAECFEMWGGGGGGGRGHTPTQISQNVLCIVHWHKQTSLQSEVSSLSLINQFVTMHISRQLFRLSCFKVFLG